MSARDWAAPKWVNTEGDEGAVGALLDRLGRTIPPESVDELWIFATRRAGGIESTVLVVACFTEDADRRDVSTARFLVTRDRKGRATVDEQIDHHATAPADAVGRVVDGVLRRLGDDAAQPPRLEAVSGDRDRWDALVRELGGVPAPREEAADPAAAGSPPLPEAEGSAINNES